MKIEWFYDDLDKARITRRCWPRFWVVEQAIVYRKPDGAAWYYEGRTHDPRVEGCFEGFAFEHTGLAGKISASRRREEQRIGDERDARAKRELAEMRRLDNPWQPVQR